MTLLAVSRVALFTANAGEYMDQVIPLRETFAKSYSEDLLDRIRDVLDLADKVNETNQAKRRRFFRTLLEVSADLETFGSEREKADRDKHERGRWPSMPERVRQSIKIGAVWYLRDLKKILRSFHDNGNTEERWVSGEAERLIALQTSIVASKARNEQEYPYSYEENGLKFELKVMARMSS